MLDEVFVRNVLSDNRLSGKNWSGVFYAVDEDESSEYPYAQFVRQDNDSWVEVIETPGNMFDALATVTTNTVEAQELTVESLSVNWVVNTLANV